VSGVKSPELAEQKACPTRPCPVREIKTLEEYVMFPYERAWFLPRTLRQWSNSQKKTISIFEEKRRKAERPKGPQGEEGSDRAPQLTSARAPATVRLIGQEPEERPAMEGRRREREPSPSQSSRNNLRVRTLESSNNTGEHTGGY